MRQVKKVQRNIDNAEARLRARIREKFNKWDDRFSYDGYKLELDGETIDVLKNIVFCCGYFSDRNIEEIFSKTLTYDEVSDLIGKVFKLYEDKSYKTIVNKDESEDDLTDTEISIMSAMVSNITYKSVEYLFNEFESNSDFITELVIEACVGAFNALALQVEHYPNTYIINALVVYTWMNTWFNTTDLLASFRSVVAMYRASEPTTDKFEDNKNLESVIKTYFPDNYEHSTVIKYLKVMNKKTLREALYATVDDFTKCIMLRRKNKEAIPSDNGWMNFRETIDDLIDAYPESLKLLDPSRLDNYTAYALVNKSGIYNINASFSPVTILSYELKMLNDNEDKSGRLDALKHFIGESLHWVNGEFWVSVFETLLYCYDNLKTTYSKTASENEKVKADFNQLSEKVVRLRERLRDKSKEYDSTKELLRLEKLKNKELEKKKNSTVTEEEYEQVTTERDHLLARLNEIVDKLKDTNRALSKKEKELEQQQELCKKLEADYNSAIDRYESSRAAIHTLAVHRQYDMIPIEDFVNAMSDKKICLFGGDMIHSRMVEYGFRNLRLYKAGAKSLSYEDIASTDLLVIITSYIDHSSISSIVDASKTHDIPILRTDDKNPESIILQMFHALMGNK